MPDPLTVSEVNADLDAMFEVLGEIQANITDDEKLNAEHIRFRIICRLGLLKELAEGMQHDMAAASDETVSDFYKRVLASLTA